MDNERLEKLEGYVPILRGLREEVSEVMSKLKRALFDEAATVFNEFNGFDDPRFGITQAKYQSLLAVIDKAGLMRQYEKYLVERCKRNLKGGE